MQKYIKCVWEITEPTSNENNDGNDECDIWGYVAPEVAQLLLNIS